MKKILIILLFLVLLLPAFSFSLDMNFYFLGGYSFAVNSSYVDTHANKDIYWNPNNGWAFKTGLGFVLSKTFEIRIDITAVFGYYKYKTDDGGKVNTESNANRRPPTMNTEWSQSFNFHVTFITKLVQKGRFIPYIGLGIGLGYLKSYETWEYSNVNNLPAKLYITKYYPIALSLAGSFGFRWMLTKKLGLMMEATFTVVNFVMKKVVLHKYTIDGVDHTNDYSLAERTYTYDYNIPDENKGGECLLAGFAYSNYPQQKIGTSLGIYMGIIYNF